MINDKFLKKYKVDLLVHGNDKKNKLNKKSLNIIKNVKKK